ncbi:MAG TPA: hypothetical protein VMV19_12885 [Xanthobacteraceae bacterium]|nr:hypothetical protein [Xanthobacteraceae bacterium]
MPPSHFSPVTEADLDRAREDPAFRHKLLQQNLDLLLRKLQKQRQTARPDTANASLMREGVTLAVRIAELIQGDTGGPPRTN